MSAAGFYAVYSLSREGDLVCQSAVLNGDQGCQDVYKRQTWNEFYFALMLTSGDSARTVPIALNYYMGTFANNYSALFAAVVMTVMPTILVFIILQRQVMESLTAGAVKG